MKLSQQLRWVFLAQALTLLIAGWRNLHQLNPDAIAYVRLAGYYASGQMELAVTGYWGPLLSWLMVPLMKLGVAPLVAARVLMAGSGVVFLVGAVAVFRAFRLPPVAFFHGACIAAGWSVFWSVRHISPDLLLAGLVGLAVSATMKLFLHHTLEDEASERCSDGEVPLPKSAAARANFGAALAAGAWWGLAYLAKAVALPLALLVTAGLAMTALSGRGGLRRAVVRKLAISWLGVALVAGPWMGVLSLHYGKFTFSTTGPIAHALAGPDEGARYHPAMVTLHQPDVGRVTQWEEPSRMAYQRWSPLAGGENFRHQLRVIGANVGICWNWLNPWSAWVGGAELPLWRRWLGTFDLFGVSSVAVVVAGYCGWKHRQRLRQRRWCWALVPAIALAGLYLPFFVMAEDNRYFYPLLPFLWVLAIGGLGWVASLFPRLRNVVRRVGFSVISGAFMFPVALWMVVSASVGLPKTASETARMLAEKLSVSGAGGPIAGSAALPGGRTGLYTAFLLGERWLGDLPDGRPADFASAGAKAVITRQYSKQAAAFAQDRNWRRVEFGSTAPVDLFLHVAP